MILNLLFYIVNIVSFLSCIYFLITIWEIYSYLIYLLLIFILGELVAVW